MSGTSYPQVIQLPTSKRYQGLFPGYHPTTTDYGPGGGMESTYIDPSGLPGNVFTLTPPGSSPAPGSAPATAAPGFGPSIPGGYTTSNPPTTPGWFYNSQTGRFEYGNGAGSAPTTTAPDASGNQVPGLGGVLNPAGSAISSAVPKLSWIEELGIRFALVFVGIVLVFAGFYVAGKRGGIDNPRGLVR